MSSSAPKKAKSQPQKREKIFHPNSRKAGQLERKQLRKAKLDQASIKRAKKNAALSDKNGFLFHALPPDVEALALEHIHELIQTVWLTRHDEEIEEEQARRKKNRPPSVKEVRLQNLRAAEVEEYRTGLELVDLTYPPNVELFRQWDQSDVPYLRMLRYIRINSTKPDQIVVSQKGRHVDLMKADESTMDLDTVVSHGDEAPTLLNLGNVSSTMQTMDV